MSQQKESQYLFHLQQKMKKLFMFTIVEKVIKTVNIDFKIPSAPGFCHLRNELYLGGGFLWGVRDKFRNISHSGKVEELKSLPTAKAGFPMSYWSREDALVTVGG